MCVRRNVTCLCEDRQPSRTWSACCVSCSTRRSRRWPVAACSPAGSARATPSRSRRTSPASRGCIGCGSCIDACPVLMRDPARRQRTDSRTSFALEILVHTDCDRCGNCVLACPQVDTTIKHYVVHTHLAEGMAQLLARATSDEALYLDLMLQREALDA
ncbi:MAG: 4Fe-4S dicluster domain-containing protein [Anaerolineae bacterium]|nr:4Fe-4S dicluster domain-containing protein [Anaerolineae bacterium]